VERRLVATLYAVGHGWRSFIEYGVDLLGHSRLGATAP